MNHDEISPSGQDWLGRTTKSVNKRHHHKSRLAARTAALTLSLFGIAQFPASAEILATFDSTVKYADAPVFLIEVTGNNPTGTIKMFASHQMFDDNGLFIGGPLWTRCVAPVLDGKAVCVLDQIVDYMKFTPVDDPVMGFKVVPYHWNLQIDYSGDANNPAASLIVKQLIDDKAITLSGTSVPAYPMAGQDVTLSAVVRTSEVNGSVVFSRAGKPISGCASVPVSRLPENKYSLTPGAYASTTGVATCTVKSIEAGNQSIDLAYANDVGTRTQAAKMNVQARSSGVSDHSGMYWNPAESGWGMSVVQHGDKQLNVIYGYDSSKVARWYVLPSGTWNGANTEYRGVLYQPTSAPYDAYHAKSFNANDPVGEAVITYAPSGMVTLSYLINGERGSKEMTKQTFGPNDSKTRLNVADMWWGGEDDAREYGWGVSIAQQGNMLFPIWFTYDAQGKATWYPLMQAPANYVSYIPPVNANEYGWFENRYFSHVYSINASKAPSENFLANSLTTAIKGTVVLTFLDQEHGTIGHPVPCDGSNYLACTQWKKLRRQKF